MFVSSAGGCRRVLAVMGMICAGFLAFILFTSGPFARTLPCAPVEGARPGLPCCGAAGWCRTAAATRRPVGFSVASALRHRRAAERASGRVHPFARPWTLAAWCS
ncbi:hypothetical protein OQK38_20110 [Salmonella enterica]|nr:hypothetical protein [Salmonella enterica]